MKFAVYDFGLGKMELCPKEVHVQKVTCAACGWSFTPSADEATSGRTPCPTCGSTTRHVVRELSSSIPFDTQFVAHKPPANPQPSESLRHIEVGDKATLSEDTVAHGQGSRSEVVSVSDSRGRASSSKLSEEGLITHTIRGKPPQGEEGALEACHRLIQHLNRNVGVWRTPVGTSRDARRERGHDAEALSLDGRRHLYIQVVRAEQSLWSAVAKHGNADASYDNADEMADVLKRSIEHKKTRASEDVLLAIDALDAGNYAFQEVVRSFRDRHGAWADELGFEAVWVVGPTDALIARLDGEPPATAKRVTD